MVYALPTVARCLMMGTNNLCKMVGYDFHHIRKKHDVPSVCVRPCWRLFQQHLGGYGVWIVLGGRKRGETPTNLGMIWRTKLGLKTISPIGGLQRLDYDGYVNQWSFLVSIEYLGIYVRVREEEQVISLQFIGSQNLFAGSCLEFIGQLSTRRKSGSKSMTLHINGWAGMCLVPSMYIGLRSFLYTRHWKPDIIVDYLIVRQCQNTTPLETRIASELLTHWVWFTQELLYTLRWLRLP